MEIRSPAHLPGVPAVAAAPAQQAASLKLGAIFNVIVQARLGENRFQFQRVSDGESLTGISLADLPIGQRLQVEVARLGVLPELRILPAEIQTLDVVPKALRELLPKQIEMKDLASILGRLPVFGFSGLSDSLRSAIERLAAALPQVEKLMTPDGLQESIQNSGLYLEASLAAVLTEGMALPENDLKARLLTLLAALQGSDAEKSVAMPKDLPRETVLPASQAAEPQSKIQAIDDLNEQEMLDLEKLAQKAEGALAKMTIDQLASQPRDNDAISLQLNIPFAAENYPDNAKLKITSEGSAAHDESVNPFWTATIELQPPGMGIFNARVVWNGTRIDACLWCDKEETRALMSSAAETLRARLEQAGLETGALTILDDPPSLSSESDADMPPILDLRA